MREGEWEGGMDVDMRVREIIDPLPKAANAMFHEWPIKLRPLPKFVSDAFDGSKYIIYTTTLVTVGNDIKCTNLRNVLFTSHLSHI